MFRLLILNVLLGAAPGAALAAPPAPQEIKAAWESYLDKLRSAGLRGTCTASHTITQDKTSTTTRTQGNLAIGEGGTRFDFVQQESSTKGSDLGRAYGRNAKYLFQLDWSVQASGWRLRRIFDPDSATDANSREPAEFVLRTVGLSLLTFSVDYLPEFTELDKFTLSRPDPGSVRAALANVTSQSKRNRVVYHDATWEFDAENFYVLKTGTAKVRMNQTEGTLTVIHQYRIDAGLPVPTRRKSVQDYSTKETVFKIESEEEYDLEVGTRPTPIEFSLTHYGLPEPPGVTWEHPTPTYVWLLLAAGIFGVVALGCRWLRSAERNWFHRPHPRPRDVIPLHPNGGSRHGPPAQRHRLRLLGPRHRLPRPGPHRRPHRRGEG